MAKYGLLEVGKESPLEKQEKDKHSYWKHEKSKESIHRKDPLSGLQTNARLSDSLKNTN